jgi:hypothetical protein
MKHNRSMYSHNAFNHICQHVCVHNHNLHAYIIYSCTYTQCIIVLILNTIFICHVFHHDDLEGLTDDLTHHPTTSTILTRPSRKLPLYPNITPRIYHFSAKHPLKLTRRNFLSLLCNTSRNPSPLKVFLVLERRLQSRIPTQVGRPLDTCTML